MSSLSQPMLFGLAGLGVLVYVWVNWRRFQALRRRGVQTTGLIVGHAEDAELEPEALVVAFRDAGGRLHQIVSHGRATHWGRRRRRQVTVTYDPADPRRARIHEDVRLQSIAGAVFSAIFLAIAVALAIKN